MFRQGNRRSGDTGTFRLAGNGSFGETNGFSDFFHSLFGQEFSEHQPRRRNFDRPGRSHEADITVTLRELITGARKSISLQSYEYDAAGQAHPTTRTFQVKIPKGVTEGSVIRLPGQGENGAGSGATGDLLLRIHIAADSRFSIDGYDLHTTVTVAPWEAVLGAKVDLQTVDGSVTLELPKGSQNGRKMRIRGKGLPKKNGQPGNIIATLQIQVPTTLSKEEKQLFEELAAKSRFNPRMKMHQRAN